MNISELDDESSEESCIVMDTESSIADLESVVGPQPDFEKSITGKVS